MAFHGLIPRALVSSTSHPLSTAYSASGPPSFDSVFVGLVLESKRGSQQYPLHVYMVDGRIGRLLCGSAE